MIAAALIRRAVSETRGMDNELDSLRITRHLIRSGIILGDEEARGEDIVIDALDAVGWEDAHESQIVAELLEAFGYEAVA